jgi:hypothetical protein
MTGLIGASCSTEWYLSLSLDWLKPKSHNGVGSGSLNKLSKLLDLTFSISKYLSFRAELRDSASCDDFLAGVLVTGDSL